MYSDAVYYDVGEILSTSSGVTTGCLGWIMYGLDATRLELSAHHSCWAVTVIHVACESRL
jgi:hypothetical protein